MAEEEEDVVAEEEEQVVAEEEEAHEEFWEEADLVFTPENQEEVIDVDQDDNEKKAYEVEIEHGDDTPIHGAKQYGYGMWTRWLYNGYTGKVVQKAPWHGLSRFTVNRGFGDVASHGDRTLAIWIGQGYYHFTTHDTITNRVNYYQNIDYGLELDNNWVYVYFCYKKLNE